MEEPDDDAEEVDFSEGVADDEDLDAEDALEGAGAYLTDEEYENAVAPEPPVVLILVILTLVALAIFVVASR